MGRKSPVFNNSTDENGSTRLKKGTWSAEEDKKLSAYIRRYGIWNWNHMAKPAGLMRSGKSCRLRWLNYLRPNIRHGNFSREEIEIIIRWHKILGNRWTKIAEKLHGRTDNEIKNYWNSRLKKRIIADESNEAPKSTETSGNGSCSSMDGTSPEGDGIISRVISPQSFWDDLHLPELVDISFNLEDEFSMTNDDVVL